MEPDKESIQPKFETLLSLFEDAKGDKQRFSGDFSVVKRPSPQVPPRSYSLHLVNGGQPIQQPQSSLSQSVQHNNNNNHHSNHHHHHNNNNNEQQPQLVTSGNSTPGLLSPTSQSSNMGVNNRPLSTSIDLLRSSGNRESMNRPLRPLSASTSPTLNSSTVVDQQQQFRPEELIREIKNERALHNQTKYHLQTLQSEHNKVTSDLAIWRAKYYKLLTKNTKLKVILDHFQSVMNESDSVPGENTLNTNQTSPNQSSTTPRKHSLVNGYNANDNNVNSNNNNNSNNSNSNNGNNGSFISHSRSISNTSTNSTISGYNGSEEQRNRTYSYSERTKRPAVNSATFFPPPTNMAQNRATSNSSFQLTSGDQEYEEISEEEYHDMLEKRRQISLQILQTEQEYASYLNIIVEEFLNPLKVECYQSNNPFINSIQVKQLFGDIEVILGSSRLLAEDLENVLCGGTTTNPTGLGDVFLKICDYFKLYSPYVKNYYTSISVLNKLKEESHKFQTFIQEKEQTLLDNNFTDLGALLVLPVSRIGQYTSMINVLFNLTPQTHPDYEPFRNAVIKMKSIVDYVKEKIRDNESQNKVRIIQNQMTGKFENLNLPHRRYIKEGTLTEGSKNSSSNATQYYCFLFNDILVLSTPIKKSNQYSFKKRISFVDAEVSIISDAEERPVFQISIPTNDSSLDTSPNMLSLNGISNAINSMTESKSSKSSFISSSGSGINGNGNGNGNNGNGNNSGINTSSGINNSSSNNDEQNKEEKETFVFVADSIRDRDEWIQAIQFYISALKKKSDNRKPEDIERGGIDFNTSEIRLCEQIGSGGSGCTVHRCTVDGFTCAVKVLKLKNTSPYLVEQFIGEINIMVKLNNQNIAKYLGHRLTQNQLWLFMEFYPHSLKDIISKRTTPFPATEVIWMALEIAKGLEFLHTQKPPIIHRDLKPGNIMCALDDKNRVCNIRVCDFDTSKELGSGVTLKTCIGTPCYMAAEVLNVSEENLSGYSLKADIWSFAMLCFEMISLLPPYHQFQHLQSIEMIISGTAPPLPTNLLTSHLQPLIELLVTCIDLNQSRRPSAAQLVQKLTKMLKNNGMLQQ